MGNSKRYKMPVTDEIPSKGLTLHDDVHKCVNSRFNNLEFLE
jgi:hypothetical protein